MTKPVADCRFDDNDARSWPELPKYARLPINRCNLPPVILGSVSFQRQPVPLLLDGVRELHARLFVMLDGLEQPQARAQRFMDYMTVYFRLEALEEVGLTPGRKKRRGRADYRRMVRGWAFDPDYREGAVLKGWVESRFGLLALYHGGSLRDRSSETWLHYLEARSRGLYCTNSLETQLDLLYTYAQYELQRPADDRRHLQLYRGFNTLGDDEVLARLSRHRWIVLLNNISSFSLLAERASQFGDHIIRVQVPLSKIFFYNLLLPGLLKGEDEFVVIGGVYEVERLA